jgi:hypothetical protein
MTELHYLTVIAVATLIGNTMAVVVGSILSAHYAKRAEYVASKAATIFDNVAKVVIETHGITASTHRIVNSQRTQMLRLIAALSARIAKDNPGDEDAQIALRNAMTDADKASNGEH